MDLTGGEAPQNLIETPESVFTPSTLLPESPAFTPAKSGVESGPGALGETKTIREGNSSGILARSDKYRFWQIETQTPLGQRIP